MQDLLALSELSRFLIDLGKQHVRIAQEHPTILRSLPGLHVGLFRVAGFAQCNAQIQKVLAVLRFQLARASEEARSLARETLPLQYCA